MLYDLNDVVPVRHLVYNSAGALTAATVTLSVVAPDGTTSSPTVTTSATGVYNATITANQAGVWSYTWSVSGTVPQDYIPGSFSVATRAPLAYTSVSKLKLALGISTDTTRDELLVDAVNAASRYVERFTGRKFYPDSATSARVYRVKGRTVRDSDGERLLVDDIASTTGLVVEYGSNGSYTTLASDDYETGPDNALARGEPIEWLLATRGWFAASPYTRVRVTARWGWPSVPDEIAEATRLQAARLFRRKDSPEGVAGSAEWGAIRLARIDPDVEALIRPYALPGFGG